MQLRAEDHMAVAVVTDLLGRECGQVASCLVRYPLISHRDILRLSGLDGEKTSLALTALIRHLLVHFIDVPRIHSGLVGQTVVTVYAFHSRVAYCMGYAPKLLVAMRRSSILEAEILRHYLTIGASSADTIQSTLLTQQHIAAPVSLGPAEFMQAMDNLVASGYLIPFSSLSLIMKKQILKEYLTRHSIRETEFREHLDQQDQSASGHSTASKQEPGDADLWLMTDSHLTANRISRKLDASLPRRSEGDAGDSAPGTLGGPVAPTDALVGIPGAGSEQANVPAPAPAASTKTRSRAASRGKGRTSRGKTKKTNQQDAQASSEDDIAGLVTDEGGGATLSSLASLQAGDHPAEPLTKRRLPESMVAPIDPSLREILDSDPQPSFKFSGQEVFAINFEALLAKVKCEAIVADYRAKYNDSMAAVVRACLAVAGCTHKLVSLPLFGDEQDAISISVPIERIVECINQYPPPDSVQRAAAMPLRDMPAALSQVSSAAVAYPSYSLDGVSATSVAARGEAGIYTHSTICQYLEVLSNSPTPLVSLRDSTSCDVQVAAALKSLQLEVLDQVLERRHGPGAIRVIRLLRLRGNLEPQTVASEALLPLSNASVLLTSMHREGLLRVFQLPRTADYNPDYTTYLYGEDPEYYNKMVNVVVKIIYNMWQRIESLHAAERAAADPTDAQSLRERRGYMEYIYARLLDIGVLFS